MFGTIRPCRHRLGGELGAAWQAHLCGMCLSLRDDHGQVARLATNYDGLVISVLAEAQADGAPERRTAGRCALRRMRKLDVATGDCARLAATVSLVLAAAKVRDHADDGDGAFGRPGVRGAATALATRWAAAGTRTGRELGFEVGVLTEAIGRQAAIEAAAGPGTPLLTVTEPTETATAAAFAHTALLAGKPENQAALSEAGRLFGRIAHLVDAVEDLTADRGGRRVEPAARLRRDVAEARRLCDDALLGIKLALNEAGVHRRPPGARPARARAGPFGRPRVRRRAGRHVFRGPRRFAGADVLRVLRAPRLAAGLRPSCRGRAVRPALDPPQARLL